MKVYSSGNPRKLAHFSSVLEQKRHLMFRACDSFGNDVYGYPCNPVPKSTDSFPSSDWHILIVVIAVLIALAFLSRTVRVIQAHQNGVVFRLGKSVGVCRPGLVFVLPLIDRVVRVNMWQETLGLESQSVVSKDNVSLTVEAVVYFKVTNAIKALVNVDDYRWAMEQRSAAVIRQVIGGKNLDEILTHGATITDAIKEVLSSPVAIWGLEVEDIQLKDINLPKGLKRAMAAQAEAQREAAAKVIAAGGERDSAELLKIAADRLGVNGLALRRLLTMLEIATDQSPIIIMDSSDGYVAAAATAGGMVANR